MIVSTPYYVSLSVLEGGKGIPYYGIQRENGTANHGFVALKGKSELIAAIPEAQTDEAIAEFLRITNATHTGVFTVGCESGDIEEASGWRVSGYVEFGINDKEMIQDAIPYFQIFFNFTRRLSQLRFSQRVNFNWDLLQASFTHVDCSGMTCSIVVNTHHYGTREHARECWKEALHVLGQHLASIPDVGFARLY